MVTNREPRSSHPSLTPSQLCRTKDGWLFIMCNKEKFWPVLAEALGKPEWATDPDYATFAARLKNRERITQELDAVLMTATTEEWMSRLRGKVPIAPVYDVRQALDNPFVAEQQLVLDFEHAAARQHSRGRLAGARRRRRLAAAAGGAAARRGHRRIARRARLRAACHRCAARAGGGGLVRVPMR